MSKPVKELITREYQSRYGELDSACVVNLVGLDAISTNRLRGELRRKDIRLQIIKNSLARRAFAESGLAPLAEALSGPCALVTGGESAIDVAKTLVETRRSYPKIELKVGILAGDPELIPVERLALMKNRQELLGDLAMLILSPGGRVTGCLRGPGGRIAGCLNAMIDNAEAPAA